MGILTTDEKKYLNRVSNYLNSMGMDEGIIYLETQDGQPEFTDIFWNTFSHFDNNNRAAIPDGLISILDKIFKHIEKNELFVSPQEEVSSSKLVINIFTDTKKINVLFDYFYYSESEPAIITWNRDSEIIEKMESILEEAEISAPDNELTIKYDGGGDSGYLNSDFEETHDEVPKSIQDWCYEQLEINFGGWEINEGSYGKFFFNFKKGLISLVNSQNYEDNDDLVVFSENFEL